MNYEDQPNHLPTTHLVRRALTLPSGRLKEGVRVADYLDIMDRAQQSSFRLRTHGDAAAWEDTCYLVATLP